MAVLRVNGGEYDGNLFQVERDCFVIGRSMECDLILHDSEVSPRHVQIIRRGKSHWLQDLNGKGGTRLDGRPIIQAQLQSGAVFAVGGYRCAFSDEDIDLNVERELSAEEVRRFFHGELIKALDLKKVSAAQARDQSLRNRAHETLEKLIYRFKDRLSADHDVGELKRSVLDAALGLGPLEALLADDSVTEIMVNGPRHIYVERDGRLERSRSYFLGTTEILTAIERIVGPLGRRIDESSPMVDARLSDGSRVNAIISPLALDSPILTIRKFPKRRMGMEDLIRFDSLSEPMARFIRLCAIMARNVVISGGTGSGKTTLLNIFSSAIPEGERIVTVEDSAELSLPQDHVVRLETRPPNIEGRGEVTIRDLVRNALRMRPDRIVVGECRGGEALDMLQAMNTGHDGSLTTVHANSAEDAGRRLENLVLMSGIALPLTAVRELIASAIHLVVQISRLSDGTRKLISITEVVGIRDGEIQYQDIFKFHVEGIASDGRVRGSYSATGIIPKFVEEMVEAGMEVEMDMFVPDAPVEAR